MGRSMFGWFSATCSWVFTTIIEGMVGIKPGYTGFKIEPCLPKKWKTLSAEFTLRNAHYTINISNPKGKETGVDRIMIDEKMHNSQTIPYFKDKNSHNIEIFM